MKEEFLHYLWRYRLYDPSGLCTVDGKPVEVEDPGYPHQDGGPDFQEARLRLGALLWAGNVEIHFRSSQWYEHGHHRDPAYDNVILHVVLEADKETRSSTGLSLDTLELRDRIPQGLAHAYERFMNDRKRRIACEGSIEEVPTLLIRDQLDRLSVERLEKKAERIEDLWRVSDRDPREAFYRLLLRYFGGRVNATPFEQLAGRVPLDLLLRERESLCSLEALLFGQAGLLDEGPEGDHPEGLIREYGHLRKKYGLRSMDPSAWRFLRLRPADFPTLRIAQVAALIHRKGDPWTAFLSLEKGSKAQRIFMVSASEYWKEHHKFGRERKRKASARVGAGLARRLVINALVPFLFFYGKKKGEAKWKEEAIGILEGMNAEEDRIQREWKRVGVVPENASRSQGAIELMEAYCDPRKCLDCAIGDHILKERAT